MYRKKGKQLMLALILVASLSVGCSSNKGGNDFQVAVISGYADETQIQEYGKVIKDQLGEEVTTEGEPIEFVGISMGDPAKDPMMAVGGTTKVAGMVAAKEIDVIISDLENAAKYARDEMFYSLEDIFTPEELAGLDQSKFLTFDQIDEEGNPTGEKTAACGIDLSANENFKQLTNGKPCGIFIVGNTEHLEMAKEVFLSCLTIE